MIIGVPKEIKNNENRVAITPAGVETLTNKGHKVLIEQAAGEGSGITDKDYQKAGAEILADKKEIFATAKMIMKVKEPLPEEYDLFREGQILYTYLHLAAEEGLTKALMEKNVVAIAYETVQLADGSLPLLTPMSEVAGRLAVQAGALFLEKPKGGRGILLGGVPGTRPAKVVVIGGGVVGINSAKIAKGMGADVTIIDVDASKLRYLDNIFNGNVKTIMSNKYNVHQEVAESDLVIGAVLITGAKAPNIVTEEMVEDMKDGAVVVDVAIDQGGCIETSYPTTHQDPVYKKHGVIHYGVSNMPGSVARTSTYALTNVTVPYAVEIADKGYKKALLDNVALLKGLNVYQGKVTYKAVAQAFTFDYHNSKELLNK